MVRADREGGSPAGRPPARRVREGRFTERRGKAGGDSASSSVRLAPVIAHVR